MISAESVRWAAEQRTVEGDRVDDVQAPKQAKEGGQKPGIRLQKAMREDDLEEGDEADRQQRCRDQDEERPSLMSQSGQDCTRPRTAPVALSAHRSTLLKHEWTARAPARSDISLRPVPPAQAVLRPQSVPSRAALDRLPHVRPASDAWPSSSTQPTVRRSLARPASAAAKLVRRARRCEKVESAPDRPCAVLRATAPIQRTRRVSG